MEIIVRGRGGGKTTELVNWLIENKGAAVICLNAISADLVKRLLRSRGVDVSSYKFLGMDRARELLHGHTGPVAVDDMDRYFYDLFGHRPDFITMSDD